MTVDKSRTLSLAGVAGHALQQQPQFATPYVPSVIRFSQQHRLHLEPELRRLPESWSFEDRLLAWLIPELQLDISQYHRSSQHDLGDLFDNRQLLRLDTELVQRVWAFLHNLWGLKDEPPVVDEASQSGFSILAALESAGILGSASAATGPEGNPSCGGVPTSDARVSIRNDAIHITLLHRVGGRLVKWTTYRKIKLYHLILATFRRQIGFLDSGPDYLRSFTISEAAKLVGLHESAASRLIAGLSVDTPHGPFPLGHFFCHDVESRSIQNTVASLIRDEVPTTPLTDDQIAQALRERGIAIARRTVAKYRGLLGIPTAVERRSMSEREGTGPAIADKN